MKTIGERHGVSAGVWQLPGAGPSGSHGRDSRHAVAEQARGVLGALEFRLSEEEVAEIRGEVLEVRVGSLIYLK